MKTTIDNIQKIIDITNSFECESIQDIVNNSKGAFSRNLVSKNLKRINENCIRTNKNIKINCKKAEETEFVKKIKSAVEIITNEPSMLFWQTKYLSHFLDLTTNEVQIVCAYARKQLIKQ